MRKVYIVFLLFIFSQTIFSQHTFNHQPINLNPTKQQWREDLRYFAKELPKRHKNAFHTMSHQQFETAVKKLDEDIPKLSNEEIYVRFLKLIAMVNDGHTSAVEESLFNFGIYPVRYEMFQDGLFVVSSLPKYKDIVGGKVVNIGNKPIEEVLNDMREIAYHDPNNEMQSKTVITFFLLLPKVLKGLKIVNDDRKVSLTVEINKKLKTVELEKINTPMAFHTDPNLIDANENAKNPRPLYLKNPNDYYWFEYIQDKKIAYIQFNRTLNKKDSTVKQFFTHIFEAVENAPVEKLILDLRFNTGGDNFLNKPIVLGLIKSKLNKRGKLFVVIGRKTVSAAQNLVNELEKYTNAIFVGEPTGSNQNLYGDPVKFTLPNSKLSFRASSLWHQFNARDTRKWTAPEIATELTFQDYQKNTDPAWDAILNYKHGQTFRDLTLETISNKDISVFIKKYSAFKKTPANKYVNTEAETNTLGYSLIQAKRVKDAIEVFILNVKDYPNSANVYDSLGEAYYIIGDKTKAIENYEKALSINPKFQSSIDALTKLKHKN